MSFTAKQRDFCDAYIDNDGDIEDALRQAGYEDARGMVRIERGKALLAKKEA